MEERGASSAFVAARDFIETGLELVPADGWETEFELTFALRRELFECAYITGDFQAASEAFEVALEHAESDLERASLYYTRVLLHTSEARPVDAVQTGIDALRLFKIKVPFGANTVHVFAELAKVRLRLRTRGPAELLALPDMEDPEARSAVALLMSICPAAYFENPNVMILVALKIMGRTLQRGTAPESAFGFVLYGLVLGAALGNHRLGHEFGRLGVQVSGRFEDVPLVRSKVLLIHAGFVDFWCQPIDDAISLLEEAFAVAESCGDLQYGSYAALQHSNFLLYRAAPLLGVLEDIEGSMHFVKAGRDSFAIDGQTHRRQAVLALTGQTNSLGGLSDAEFDEPTWSAEMRIRGNRTSLIYYLAIKQQLTYLAGDFTESLVISNEADSILDAAFSQLEAAKVPAYRGLAAASQLRAGCSEKRKLRKILKQSIKPLRKFAADCPENFEHIQTLLEAELASLSENGDEAARLYERAVLQAKSRGFLDFVGIAAERTADHFAAAGNDRVAMTYLSEARRAFSEWGAVEGRPTGQSPSGPARKAIQRARFRCFASPRRPERRS